MFDVLNDGGPKLVLCRHEQNAAFMAAAVGRLTGRPGVCLVTSGPGTGNLVTGIATATTEGDPMVAVGGTVPLTDSQKQTHQSIDAVALMRPVTKFSAEIRSPQATCEVVTNAFRSAMTPHAGAALVAMPSDVAKQTSHTPLLPAMPLPALGAASASAVQAAVDKISNATFPVLLIGMGGSEPTATAAIRALLRHHAIAVVGTFQGAGAVSRDLLPLFFGRIGLFRNQPGDKLLAKADIVLTVGYDPVEYDPDFGTSANIGRSSIWTTSPAMWTTIISRRLNCEVMWVPRLPNSPNISSQSCCNWILKQLPFAMSGKRCRIRRCGRTLRWCIPYHSFELFAVC